MNAKRSLRKTPRNAKLDYDELHTVLVEVEGTLNSRPLTFVSSGDVEEPLTPVHLIYGRGILSLLDFTRNREASFSQAVSSDDMPRRRQHLQLLLDHFWKRWSREYVTELRKLHRKKSRQEKHISRSVGDVVTLFEDNRPLSQWRLARAEQLIPSSDDNVRAAVVRIITKTGRPGTVKRIPIQRLFPLEAQDGVTNDEQPSQERRQEGARQTRRAAALNADYMRRLTDQ